MGTAADFAKAGDMAGAIVLAHSDVLKTWDDLFQEYFRAPGIIDRARKGRPGDCLYLQPRARPALSPHQHQERQDRCDSSGPAGARRFRANRALAGHGEKVQMSLSMPNQIGPTITTRNVVAELKGTELPERNRHAWARIWIHGSSARAHSTTDATRRWSSTLCGRSRRRAFVRSAPLRFILFSGEEEGLLGSCAYVRAHQNELDNIVGELVLDEGTGPVTGFSTGGRKEWTPRLSPWSSRLRNGKPIR